MITDRIIEPPLDELNRLSTPLEPGEKIVLDFFVQNLDPAWEIYIQPHLNGLRPDFVLLNPKVGIAVFEVKDWDLDAIKYFSKRDELWARKNGSVFSCEKNNPFRKISQYKQKIYDLYCPGLEKNKLSVITAGVIFPFADSNRVHKMQKSFIERSKLKYLKYFPVSGYQELKSKKITSVFPDATLPRSKYMNPSLADDFRDWLVEPDYSKEQRDPLPLNGRQRKFAETRAPEGFRRIKGPAGSGKSLVLAARAARLASEGKSVLITSYNITLWHYLRDMIRRDISHPDAMRNITMKHFHDWCKDVCMVTGKGTYYLEKFKEMNKIKASSLDRKEKQRRIDKILGYDIPMLAKKSTLSKNAPRYDAILVDEAQDYLPLWWDALKNCCIKGGEMVLVSDITQDIYSRGNWTDKEMKGAGFTGRWSELKGSYRLSDNILQLTREFALEFLPENKIDLAEPRQTNDTRQKNLDFNALRWIQSSSENAKKQCVNAIISMMGETGLKSKSGNADITFICDKTAFGKSVTDELDKCHNIKTINTFDDNKEEQKRQKMAFWKGDSRIKATTLHSFKGWESRFLVIYIEEASSDEHLAAVYTGLTRIKQSHYGSWLTVVCSAPELNAFGKTWPEYKNDHLPVQKIQTIPSPAPLIKSEENESFEFH